MKKILMVCEAFGGGVFAYVSQLCNDLCDTYDIYLAYSLRPQTPKNYKNILNERVKLIEVPNFGDLKKTIFICIGEMKIDRKMPIFGVFSHNICDI